MKRAVIDIMTGEMVIEDIDDVEVVLPTNEQQKAARQEAFSKEADPLFFKWQAGEGTESEWLNKREEIRQLFPYYETASQ